MNKTYTTKNGSVIEVKPFPQLLPEKILVAAQKKALELYPGTIPTYKEELMGGGFQEFQHDEKSIVGNEEATRAWNDYQEAVQKRTRYINDKMMKFYILTGTNVRLPEDNLWKERQEFFGIELPTETMELTFHYVTTEMLVDPEDLAELVQVIMEVAGVDKDTLAAARQSFRSVLGQEQDTTGRADGDGEGESATGEVDDLQSLYRADGDGALEADAIAMGFAN